MKKFVWLLCCWSWLAASAEIEHNLNPFLIDLVEMPRYPQYFSIVAENNIVCLVDITWRETFAQYINDAQSEIKLIKIILTNLPTINDHAVFDGKFLYNYFSDYIFKEEEIPFTWVPISQLRKTHKRLFWREYKYDGKSLHYAAWPRQWKVLFRGLRDLDGTKVEIALEAFQNPRRYQKATFNLFFKQVEN